MPSCTTKLRTWTVGGCRGRLLQPSDARRAVGPRLATAVAAMRRGCSAGASRASAAAAQGRAARHAASQARLARDERHGTRQACLRHASRCVATKTRLRMWRTRPGRADMLIKDKSRVRQRVPWCVYAQARTGRKLHGAQVAAQARLEAGWCGTKRRADAPATVRLCITCVRACTKICSCQVRLSLSHSYLVCLCLSL